MKLKRGEPNPRSTLTSASACFARERRWDILAEANPEGGLSLRFSTCYSCASSRGRDDNRTWRGSVDRALCMNQPLQYDLVNLGNW
jgi:hypothetical protein